MQNKEISKMFFEIADFLELDNVAFKPAAYRKAALAISALREDIRKIYKEEGEKAIERIPGVGKSIAGKIIEYLRTGRIKYYRDYQKKYPVKMSELTAIEGLGPKMAISLYKGLGIANMKDLEAAALAGKIRNLKNFGEQAEKNILQGIKFLKRDKGRFLLSDILPKAKSVERYLKKAGGVDKINLCGSARRRKETVGDIDLLVESRFPSKVMDFFCLQPSIEKIWGKGRTKASVRTKEGFDIDLRIVPKKSYGSALQYFTGNKEHNIRLRKIAISKGLKLNEYGLFRGEKIVAGLTEESIYKILGMQCPPPELRENRGEIDAAIKGNLPKLVELKNIKGDLHCHSNWDGGRNSIREMAAMARERGYKYLGISDHTKFLKIEHGLDEKQLRQQRKEINKINSEFKAKGIDFYILQGCEANILKDGSVDITDDALKKLDYAIAGVHSNFKMSKSKMTERIIKAMENPNINIIAHPTGRILKKRKAYQIDINKFLCAARRTGTILEINSCSERLDLNDINIKKSVEAKVNLSINTDAHNKDSLGNMEYGIMQARRGWASAKDIINTYSLEKLLNFLREKQSK